MTMPHFTAGLFGCLLTLALLSGCATTESPPCNWEEGGSIKSDSSASCRWVSDAAPKSYSYVALLENPDGTTGEVVVMGSAGDQVIDKARDGAPLDGSQSAAPVSDEQLNRDFGAALRARPMLPERFLLYFDRGVKLTADSADLLPRIVESAARRPGVDVSIIGHTDSAGRADANEALALRRAESVAKQLQAQGLKVIALSVESHGESDPLVKTPDGVPEPRNRRVEVSVR